MNISGAFARQFPEIGLLLRPNRVIKPHLLILDRVPRPPNATASIQLRIRWLTISLFAITLWSSGLLS